MTTLDEQSRQLESLVIATRRRLRRNAVLTGLSLLVLVVAGGLLLAAAADALLAMPSWARWLALAAIATTGLGVLLAWILWPAVRPMPIQSVAFGIERALGTMNNRLVSVLDLRDRVRPAATAAGASIADEDRPFVRRLIEQTAERLSGYRVEQVADPAALRRTAATAGGVVVVAVAAVALSARMPTAVQRVLLPASSIPPATGVSLRGEPGDTKVLRGDPVRLLLIVEEGNTPHASVGIRTRDDRWNRYPMRRVGEGRFAFEIDAVAESFDYRFFAGGTWTRAHRVAMIQRPILASLEAAVLPPSYMPHTPPRSADVSSGQVSAVVGSTLRVVAEAEGPVNRGRVELFTRRTATAERRVDRERVWFDDDLPDDADTHGPWRWITGNVHSGRRAHTFAWNREPYGFRTRLDPLAVTTGQPMFLYARLDPEQPPTQLRVAVAGAEQRRATLVWGAPLSPEQKSDPRTRRLGDLPEPGRWSRVIVTADDLLGGDLLNRRGDASVVVHGLSFDVDGGSASFDRVGTLHAVSERVETTTLEPMRSVDMRRELETDRWGGDLPVSRDAVFRVTLVSAGGHESPEMQPVEIVATTDQPPSLVVQQPEGGVTLPEPRPLPVAVRAFDDYGLARIAIETGDSADRFPASRPLDEPTPPTTSRLVVGAIDPAKHGMERGESLYFRFAVTDAAGQTTRSSTYRLALAETPPAASPRDSKPPALDALIDGLDGLLGDQSRLSDALHEALRALPDGVTAELDEGRIRLKDEAGRPLDRKETRDALWEWNQPDREAEREELARLAERVRQQSAELARRTREAAEAARRSPTALPVESEALSDVADRLERMSEQSTDESLDPTRWAELSDEQRGDAMRQQLEAMALAKRELAEDPAAAQQRIEAVAAQMHADRMRRRMRELDEHLDAERRAMRDAAERARALAERAEAADPAELAEISRETREELDPEARELLERANQLLRQRGAGREEDAPPTPWSPPGEASKRMPVEQDTPPEREGEAAEPERFAERLKRSLRKRIEEMEREEDPAWWDRRVDTPEQARREEVSDRFEGRRRETEQARGEPVADASKTPREMLTEHNRAVGRALTENAERAAGASSEVERMLQRLERAAEGAAPTGETGAASAQRVAQLREAMRSPSMRSALRMAAAAAAQRSAGPPTGARGSASADANDPAPPGGGGGLRPGGVVLETELGELGADPSRGAALYRLPPAVRQPLIEGMSEEGPAAYQPLIDTYYRELSRGAADRHRNQ